MEAFKEEEGAVMIDPGFNIREKFNEIDLPCNKEKRVNNNINAPVKAEEKRKFPRVPRSKKTYDTDTDTA